MSHLVIGLHTLECPTDQVGHSHVCKLWTKWDTLMWESHSGTPYNVLVLYVKLDLLVEYEISISYGPYGRYDMDHM